MNTEVLIPLLFFSLEKLVQKQDFKYTVLGAFVVVLLIFGGMPESVLFALSVGGLYYLLRIITINHPNCQLKNFIKPIVLLVCVMGVGVLISAPQTLPFIELLQNSYTTHHSSTGLYGVKFSYDTITLLIPYFFGITWNNWSILSPHAILPFIGIAAFFLALLSLNRKDNKYQIITLFFWGVTTFYLLKNYALPLVNWVGYFPFFNVSYFTKYLFPEFAFSIAVLAGIGFSYIFQMNMKRILLNFSLISLIIFIFCFANFHSAQKSSWSISPLGWGFDAVSWMILNCAIAMIFLVLLTLILILLYNNKLDIRYANYIILILVTAELFMYVPHIHPERINPFEEPPYVTFLKNDSSIYRVVGLNSILYPDTASPYQIFDIRNLDALNVDRYWKFMKNLVDPSITGSHLTGDKLSVNIYNSKFLDISNVKYILSENSFVTRNASFMNTIKKQGQISSDKPSYISINPSTQDIFAHPTSRIYVNTTVPYNNSYLEFMYGLDQNIWIPGKGDGVVFQVLINDDNSEQTVFSKYINPSDNLLDRQWFSETINVSEYRGKNIQIQFITLPGPNGNNAYDWAYWKYIDIIPEKGIEERKKIESRYTLVYDNEIKIYQNLHVIPRAFVVDNVIIRNNESNIFQSLKDPAFNVSKSIILEKEIPGLEHFTPPASDFEELKYTADIVKYTSNDVLINTTLNKPGLLVLTDTNYPGWTVSVDGKAQEILAADYLFRAVYLDKGTHLVEFKYEPMSFTLGLWICLSTIIGILLTYLFINKKSMIEQKNEK
jgi:hypothetical protein